MIEFIFMLTKDDRTVDGAREVYEELRGAGLRYVGFQDIGQPVPVLRDICDTAHRDGLEVMLEVVSTSKEDELRSIEAAVRLAESIAEALPPLGQPKLQIPQPTQVGVFRRR